MSLNAYLNPLDVLVKSSFNDPYILDLYSYFWICFMIVCFTSCICVFCQTLRYTCIPLESFAFNANPYLWTQLCLGICMYTSCLTNHTYTLKWNFFLNENLVIHVFMCLCLTSCICPFYPNYCYTYTSFEPRAFMHISLWTRCVLDMYVYFSLY